MDDTNSGGSISLSLPGMSGGTTNDSILASIPPTAENLPPQDAGKVVEPAPEQVEPAKVEAQAETKVEAEKNDQSIINKGTTHEQVIDLLQEKFAQLKKGNLSEESLKDWFTKNPNFADTANRSKRLKEEFRQLMEKPVESSPSDSSEDKPLTIKDLEKYDEARETRILAKAQQREQEKEFTEFAVAHKVVDADAVQLKRNAEALYKANSDWSWQDAIKAAYPTVNTPKGSSVNAPTSNFKAPEVMGQKQDATQGIQLISWDKFSGGQVK